MNGIRTFINRLPSLLAVAGMLCTAAAATPEYLPLQPGNSWAYRVTQGRLSRPGAINVGESVTAGGKTYYKLQFFERDLLVRQAEDGSILAYDPDAKTESVWLPLGAPEKQNVPTSFDACSRAAWVENRSAKIKTDVGELENLLELRYVNSCADAGTTVQYFAPYIGLVHYEATSIAGPVTHDLVYSRTGITNIDTKVNAVTLSVDSPVYKAGQSEEALARITLRVSDPVKLTFPSGQSTDLRITNEKGESVFVWSADKLFIQVFREESVGPGEKTWVMSFPVGQLPAGTYTAEGWLTTTPRQYSANVSFQIK